MDSKTTIKTRYSDTELQEFKELITDKLNSAKEELGALTSSLSNPNKNGTDDTAGTYKTLEDGSATLEKEHDYLMSDEVVDDQLADETFDEDGVSV